MKPWAIHALFRPVPGRLKDYIGMPKANMYQSMHTTVIGQGGERLEIQIRTREMHRVAEEGIAAHWSYKERRAFHEKDAKRFTWLKQMVDLQELKNPRGTPGGGAPGALSRRGLRLYAQRRGQGIAPGRHPGGFCLCHPLGSGNSVQRRQGQRPHAVLRTELVNGDTVEIITSPHHNPSRDWLQFVKTTKARHKIRQWLKVAEREQSVTLGKELLERELRKSGASLQKLIKDGDDLKQVVQDLSFVGVDYLSAAIGHGKVSPGQVTGRLVRLNAPAVAEEVLPEAPVKKGKEEPAGLKIKDLDDLMMRLANCCQPIPGDAIMGYITRGKGVTVHRADCPYLASTETFRHIPAEWDGGGGPKKLYPVKIQVVTVDKPGLLADITSALKTAEVNVIKASVETTAENKGVAQFTIQVADQQHLKRSLAP